jgi:HEPN domain-containing protein
MPGADPSHWLHRLDAAEWLAAAETELVHCAEALHRRAFRPGVTHARRAAGMALNAVLIGEEHPAWGRSYMEHVAAVASEEGPMQEAARLLRDTPPAAPELVTLGKPDLRALEAARAITEWARTRVSALQPAPAST